MKRDRASSFHSKTARKFRRQILIAWVFAAVWLAFVGAFDVFFGWSAARQLAAASTWTRTPATVTSSEIITSKSRKGKSSYRPAVTYTYSVGGQQYTGSTIDAFGMRASGRKYAQDIAGAFPKGAAVEVFVDPSDASRAALRVGLQPATVRMLLFSLPFNAVLLGLVPFLIRARGYAADPMQGWVVVDEPDRAVLRVLHWEPWTLGCLAMGVASFVGLFGIMVASRGEPPPEHVLAVLGGSIFVGLVLYGWRRASVSTGRFDIEIDRRLKRIALPRTGGRLERTGFRCEQLRAEIEPDLKRQINRAPSWQLHLRHDGDPDGDQGGYTVYWLERSTAKLLGRWIVAECGVRLVTKAPADDAA